MQKKVLLLGVLFLLVVPLIHSGILILEPTEEVIDLGNELLVKKGSLNKSMIIEKNNETIFNITSSTPFHFIGDFSKTREWGYKNSGTEFLRSNEKLIVISDYVCIEQNKLNSSRYSITYTDCIYYPKQFIQIPSLVENITTGKLINGFVNMNMRNISLINDFIAKIDFLEDYDPTLSNFTVGLQSCWSFNSTFEDDFGTADGQNLNQVIISNAKIGNGSVNATGRSDSSVKLGTPESIWDSVFSSNFSISFWVNFWGTENQGVLISKWWDGSTRVFELEVNNPNNLRLIHTNVGGSSTQTLNTGFQFQNNNWYQVVLTVNSNGTKKVYVNNSIVGTVHLVQASSNNAPLTITSGNFSGSLRNGANIQIDELSIWNVVLNNSQVTELWNNSAGLTCSEIITSGEGEEAPPPEFTSCQDGHTTNCTFPNSFSLDKEINLTCLCNISDVSWARNISFVGTGEINVSTTISFYNISPLTDGSIGWISTNGFMNQTH